MASFRFLRAYVFFRVRPMHLILDWGALLTPPPRYYSLIHTEAASHITNCHAAVQGARVMSVSPLHTIRSLSPRPHSTSILLYPTAHTRQALLTTDSLVCATVPMPPIPYRRRCCTCQLINAAIPSSRAPSHLPISLDIRSCQCPNSTSEDARFD